MLVSYLIIFVKTNVMYNKNNVIYFSKDEQKLCISSDKQGVSGNHSKVVVVLVVVC